MGRRKAAGAWGGWANGAGEDSERVWVQKVENLW